MKSKQLANVLIKVAGFLICLFAIPNFIGAMIFGLSTIGLNNSVSLMQIFSSSISFGLMAVFGVVVIAVSHKITERMFKNDDE
jgi:membrane protein implicated in regulation of membrane protease activity